MTNQIAIFNFKDNQVRTEVKDGEPWFCLADCCDALKIKSSKDVVRQLPHKGAVLTRLLTKGGVQDAYFINEPNLYRLIFRSRKPQAQAFADWVYSEVLPSIRKTGGYGVPATVDMKAIGGLVKHCVTAAVREEVNNFLMGSPKTEGWEVSDSELMRVIYSWQASKNKADILKFRKLAQENKELKVKLAKIKQVMD